MSSSSNNNATVQVENNETAVVKEKNSAVRGPKGLVAAYQFLLTISLNEVQVNNGSLTIAEQGEQIKLRANDWVKNLKSSYNELYLTLGKNEEERDKLLNDLFDLIER